MVTAGLILLAVVPANAFLQRRAPQDVGQFPDGDPRPRVEALRSARAQVRQHNGIGRLRAAVCSFPFWCITVGHLALGTALFMINTHIVAHLVSLGYDKLVAAFVFGLIGFVRIGGTVLWGFVSDKLGRDRTYARRDSRDLDRVGLFHRHVRGAALWSVYLAAVLYSIGHSAGNPTYGAVIADIFSGRKIGLIFGFLEISFGLGSALRRLDRRLSFRSHRILQLALFPLPALLHHFRARHSYLLEVANPTNVGARGVRAPAAVAVMPGYSTAE